MEDFVEYVLSFYGTGEDAIYDYAFTREEVEAAFTIRLQNDEIEFAGDSFDRELVRDIVIEVLRGEK
jgi:hypothetical protein